MMKRGVGARGTGKRLINVRHFVEDYYQTHRSISDPFIDSVSAAEENFGIVWPRKLKFRKEYVAASESGDEEDEILPKMPPDLDESAKFVASLKMKKPVKTAESKKYVVDMPMSSADEIEQFKLASDSLTQLKLQDTVDTESESESLI
jgi:hypothetical protein